LTELLRKDVAIDSKTQKQLFETYKHDFYKIAYRYLRNQADSQDVMVDSFLKIFEQIPKQQFNDNKHFEFWMRRIVINQALALVKKQTQFFDIFQPEFENDFIEEDLVVEEISSKELFQYILELPNGCRTVFNLFAVEGYSHKEIAELLNISEGTSKSQFNRARVLLQKRLENEKYCIR
jgi:RNA polymerase sigma-70 factor, ECF subfamily